MHRLTNMHPRSPTFVSRRINYAPYSRPTPRIADKELFIVPYGGKTRGRQWASLDNKRRNSREKKRHRSTGVEKDLFFFSLLSRGESSLGFLPHWILFGVLATSEKPPKGSLGTTERDVIHRSRVHFAFNPMVLRCHSRDIKLEV